MRALVLSGGGSKGSYQAGVLSVWMGEQGCRYDLFCGVSVGAINCAHLSQFTDEKAKEAIEGLLAFWNDIRTDKVYTTWCLGELAALWRPSVYDSRPLRKYLSARFDQQKALDSGKILRVGAVSLDSGQYRCFGERDPDLLNGILASAAYPVMLTPITIDGERWTDGGVRHVTPLGEAISLGATEIDVVMCQPEEPHWNPTKKKTTLEYIERSMGIMSDEIVQTDLNLALAYNEMARHGVGQKRHVVIRVMRPKNPLPGSSLSFDHDTIVAKIERGIEDAKLSAPREKAE